MKYFGSSLAVLILFSSNLLNSSGVFGRKSWTYNGENNYDTIAAAEIPTSTIKAIQNSLTIGDDTTSTVHKKRTLDNVEEVAFDHTKEEDDAVKPTKKKIPKGSASRWNQDRKNKYNNNILHYRISNSNDENQPSHRSDRKKKKKVRLAENPSTKIKQNFATILSELMKIQAALKDRLNELNCENASNITKVNTKDMMGGDQSNGSEIKPDKGKKKECEEKYARYAQFEQNTATKNADFNIKAVKSRRNLESIRNIRSQLAKEHGARNVAKIDNAGIDYDTIDVDDITLESFADNSLTEMIN